MSGPALVVTHLFAVKLREYLNLLPDHQLISNGCRPSRLVVQARHSGLHCTEALLMGPSGRVRQVSLYMLLYIQGVLG
jgi:hypothetical protein